MNISMMYKTTAQEAIEQRVNLALAASDPDHQKFVNHKLNYDSNRMLEEEEVAATAAEEEDAATAVGEEGIPHKTINPVTSLNNR